MISLHQLTIMTHSSGSSLTINHNDTNDNKTPALILILN